MIERQGDSGRGKGRGKGRDRWRERKVAKEGDRVRDRGKNGLEIEKG